MSISVHPVVGIPEITPGDDLARLIITALGAMDFALAEGDVVVVTQKVISKAEGRVVKADPDPSAHRRLVQAESLTVLRDRDGLLIARTRHGFVCANAGIDRSNLPAGTAALLPIDPDRSAQRIRVLLERACQRKLAVVISDTFGRAWRRGQTDVAIGVAGMLPLLDLRGTRDAGGRLLHATQIAIADELAGAAELVMGKTRGVPVAVVRGVEYPLGEGRATDLVRSPADDLFL